MAVFEVHDMTGKCMGLLLLEIACALSRSLSFLWVADGCHGSSWCLEVLSGQQCWMHSCDMDYVCEASLTQSMATAKATAPDLLLRNVNN